MSVRRKRSFRHCLFRHCSGTVCSQRSVRKRRKHPCAHLRVSQEAVFDYWKTRDKPEPDAKVHECRKTLNESEQEISNYVVCDSNTFEDRGKLKDVENIADLKRKEEARTDHKLFLSCPNKETEHKEKRSPDFGLDRTISQCTNAWNISKEINNNKVSTNCACRVAEIREDRKTCFKSDLGEFSDNDTDFIFHRKSRKKYGPSAKKKSSRGLKSCMEGTINNNSRRSNIDEMYEDVISCFSKKRQRNNTKNPAKKHISNWKDNCLLTNRQSGGGARGTLSKHFSRNCTCSQRWNNSQRVFYSRCNTNLQKNNHPCEHVKRKKNNYTVAETCSSWCKAQPSQYEEKPAVVIFKSSNRPKTPEGTKFDNSSVSSSTLFTDVSENSLRDDPVAHWCPHNELSPPKYCKCNKKIDSNGPFTSSSCLSSFKQRRSSPVASQYSVYNEPRPISSSSFTNIPEYKRRYPRTYLSSTSSLCLLTSPSTYRDDYNLEESIADLNNMIAFREETDRIREQKLWRKPRCPKKRTLYGDERHVVWNIRNSNQ